MKLEFNPDFIIRGLFYDPKRCVMMKLDSYSVIDDKAAFRGLEPLSESQLDELYSTRRMGVHRVDPNFVRRGRQFYQVLDEFSIPEAYLFSRNGSYQIYRINIIVYLSSTKIKMSQFKVFINSSKIIICALIRFSCSTRFDRRLQMFIFHGHCITRSLRILTSIWKRIQCRM